MEGDPISRIIAVYCELVEPMIAKVHLSQSLHEPIKELRNLLSFDMLVDVVLTVLKLVPIMLHLPIIQMNPFAAVDFLHQLRLFIRRHEVIVQN